MASITNEEDTFMKGMADEKGKKSICGTKRGKDLVAEIIKVLGNAKEWQLEIILRFAKRIIE